MNVSPLIRSFGFILCAVLLTLLVGLGLYSCEVSSARYSSYADAAYVGALGAYKWLPSLIPSTATAIRESHDVDSNEVWFTFGFENGFDPLQHSCTATTRGAISMRIPHRWDRFPKFVKIARNEIANTEMQLYACQGDSFPFFLALNRKERRAIGWSKK